MDEMRSVLIRAPNWIGDAVMCTPALMDVREAWPQATITLLARPSIAQLLKGHPAIDDIIVYDHKGCHAGIWGKRTLIQTLKKREFSAAILFQNAFEAALLAFLAKIPKRFGYATDGRRFLLSQPVQLPGDKRTYHQVHYYQGLLKGLGWKVRSRTPSLSLLQEEEEQLSMQFPELSLDDDCLLVGINPGSIYGSAKRWLPERFAATAERLVESFEEDSVPRRKVRCVLVGGDGEESLGETIASRMQHKPIILSGKTSIRELMGVIKRCGLFITNDTGPMHIADAFGVTLVAIFGSTDPRNTSPFENGQALVRHAVRCSPCLLRHCPIDHRCMTRISIDDVFHAATTQYQRTSETQRTYTR